MGRAARVFSVDAVDALSAALIEFADEAAVALADLDLEVRRAVQWVQQDRKLYWEHEVRRGWDDLAAARRELERCMVTHKVADHRPSCIEEKKALQRAKARLDVAMEKVKAVRRWSHAVGKEADDYRGGVGQLAQWLSADYPKAKAALRRMAAALDYYLALETSAGQVDAEALEAALVTAARPVAEEPARSESPPPEGAEQAKAAAPDGKHDEETPP